jgi:DNA-binding MarR family transcriptional regulator
MAGKVSERVKQHAALDLDPLIHERARLAILSALGSEGELSFTELKGITGTTDGNLAAHTSKLEAAGYISLAKGMFGGRSKTTYAITEAGKAALMEYLNALEKLLGEVKGT